MTQCRHYVIADDAKALAAAPGVDRHAVFDAGMCTPLRMLLYSIEWNICQRHKRKGYVYCMFIVIEVRHYYAIQMFS